MSEPIVGCIDNWHRYLAGELDGGLDAILHPDVVFYSPVVFTPQRGRDITRVYLEAAATTLGAPDANFTYRTQILQGHHAMLEFETTLAGDDRAIAVNGVDIIGCDDEGLITEFKVMIRPLQAVNAVHQSMMSALQNLG